MTTDSIVLSRDPAEPSAAVSAPGTATGTPLGGNLTMLQASLCTRDLPDLRGAILLVEDTDEDPYSYDRMLTQLIRSAPCATSPAWLRGPRPPDAPRCGYSGSVGACSGRGDQAGVVGEDHEVDAVSGVQF